MLRLNSRLFRSSALYQVESSCSHVLVWDSSQLNLQTFSLQYQHQQPLKYQLHSSILNQQSSVMKALSLRYQEQVSTLILANQEESTFSESQWIFRLTFLLSMTYEIHIATVSKHSYSKQELWLLATTHS